MLVNKYSNALSHQIELPNFELVILDAKDCLYSRTVRTVYTAIHQLSHLNHKRFDNFILCTVVLRNKMDPKDFNGIPTRPEFNILFVS